MIERYTRPQMGRIWTEENKYRMWLAVETAASETLAEDGIVPLEAAEAIRERGDFDVARIQEIPSIPADDPAADALAAKARELCQRFKERDLELPAQLEQYLSQIQEPGVLADVIANTLVGDAGERQRLLEQAAEGRRLRMLVKFLTRDLGG